MRKATFLVNLCPFPRQCQSPADSITIMSKYSADRAVRNLKAATSPKCNLNLSYLSYTEALPLKAQLCRRGVYLPCTQTNITECRVPGPTLEPEGYNLHFYNILK